MATGRVSDDSWIWKLPLLLGGGIFGGLGAMGAGGATGAVSAGVPAAALELAPTGALASTLPTTQSMIGSSLAGGIPASALGAAVSPASYTTTQPGLWNALKGVGSGLGKAGAVSSIISGTGSPGGLTNALGALATQPKQTTPSPVVLNTAINYRQSRTNQYEKEFNDFLKKKGYL